MHQYFVNYLVGFLAVVATCPSTTARSFSFLDALTEEAEVDNPDALVETNIDPANSLLSNNQPDNDVRQNFGNKILPKKFLKVDLEGSRHGITIEQGQSYELSCIVDASSQASVYWIRGENPKKKINDILKTSVPWNFLDLDETNIVRIRSRHVIDCASKDDQGPIYCVAITGDRISHQSTVINVEESKMSANHQCNSNRSPVITNHISAIFTFVGSTIVLPCKAEGTPRPKTRWIDTRGVEIINHRYDDRYKILESGELMIEDLAWKDMGGPTCIAESSSGVDRAETFLYPVEP